MSRTKPKVLAVTIVGVVLGTTLNADVVPNFDQTTNSSKLSFEASLPQEDLRRVLLTEKQLQNLIDGRRCVVAFTRDYLSSPEQRTIDVSIPKTVAQVLKEAGMAKVKGSTQIRILKKYRIIQSEHGRRFTRTPVFDVIVEPGDLMINTHWVGD